MGVGCSDYMMPLFSSAALMPVLLLSQLKYLWIQDFNVLRISFRHTAAESGLANGCSSRMQLLSVCYIAFKKVCLGLTLLFWPVAKAFQTW